METHLTIEELQEWVDKADEPTRSVRLYPRCNISNDETVCVYGLAKQLLATMQREARLLKWLEYIETLTKFDGPFSAGALYEIAEAVRDARSEYRETDK